MLSNYFRLYEPVTSLCWSEFQEIFVRIPCEPENILKLSYGDNWATPMPLFAYETDAQNLFAVDALSEKEADSFIKYFSGDI